MRGPARHTGQRSRLLIGAAAWLCLSSGAGLAALLDVPTQAPIGASGAFQLPVRAAVPGPLRVQLERSPLGVELRKDSPDAWTLHWAAPDRRFASTVVLSAAPLDDLTARERYRIELRPGESMAPTEPPDPPDSAAGALQLPAVPVQQARQGRPWSLWVKPDGPPADERDVELLVEDAPDGTRVAPQPNGWHRVTLTPETIGELAFDIVARVTDEPLIEARRRITLSVMASDAELPSAPPPSPAPAPQDTATPASPGPEPQPSRLLEAPQLKGVTNQIVSAGHAVRFRVRPRVAEGQRAIVQIDRLPRNASFDENPDGSRNFHWPTGDRDQGEHRFRLTAINAEDASLRDTRELTVIVGDPTRGKTAPAQ